MSKPIVSNRKARHDYFIEDIFEAGIVLQGWEVKSIRAAKCQLSESYVKIKNNEVWILGLNITPLVNAGTHYKVDSQRLKKLLLHASEINKLIGKVERKGYSLIALDLHYTKGMVKASIALAKGKKLYDKRATEKEQEQKRDAAIAIKNYAK